MIAFWLSRYVADAIIFFVAVCFFIIILMITMIFGGK